MSFPEAMPTVTYDLAVGEHAAWTDFDYNAFYDMATEAGLNKAQIERLHINFAATPGSTTIQNTLQNPSAGQLLLGNYFPPLGRANIFVSNIHELHAHESLAAGQHPTIAVKSLEEQHNRAVIHETGHHVGWHLRNDKWYFAVQMARMALRKGVKAMATKKPENALLQDLSDRLESGIANYHDINSAIEKPAYDFEAANSSKYNIVTYRPHARVGI